MLWVDLRTTDYIPERMNRVKGPVARSFFGRSVLGLDVVELGRTELDSVVVLWRVVCNLPFRGLHLDTSLRESVAAFGSRPDQSVRQGLFVIRPPSHIQVASIRLFVAGRVPDQV